jgi:hypothetical protein
LLRKGCDIRVKIRSELMDFNCASTLNPESQSQPPALSTHLAVLSDRVGMLPRTGRDFRDKIRYAANHEHPCALIPES